MICFVQIDSAKFHQGQNHFRLLIICCRLLFVYNCFKTVITLIINYLKFLLYGEKNEKTFSVFTKSYKKRPL